MPQRPLQAADAAVDVAVLDLGLPDGAGEELLPLLRAACPRAAALVLTYFSDQERLAHAVEAGVSGVLHKSASFETVVDAVRRLDAGEQLLSLHDVITALRLVDEERQREREAQLACERLTDREREVLQALAEGLCDKEIAARLSVSPATIRSHVTSILAKLEATSRLQAVVLAARYGLVQIG